VHIHTFFFNLCPYHPAHQLYVRAPEESYEQGKKKHVTAAAKAKKNIKSFWNRFGTILRVIKICEK